MYGRLWLLSTPSECPSHYSRCGVFARPGAAGGRPRQLQNVELVVLGWRTEDGETALICRLVDGSTGTIPARWTDLAVAGGAGAGGRWGRLAGGVAVVVGACRAAGWARGGALVRNVACAPEVERAGRACAAGGRCSV